MEIECAELFLVVVRSVFYVIVDSLVYPLNKCSIHTIIYRIVADELTIYIETLF